MSLVFVKKVKVFFGSEHPLAAANVICFGISKSCVRIETAKAKSKEILIRDQIPMTKQTAM